MAKKLGAKFNAFAQQLSKIATLCSSCSTSVQRDLNRSVSQESHSVPMQQQSTTPGYKLKNIEHIKQDFSDIQQEFAIWQRSLDPQVITKLAKQIKFTGDLLSKFHDDLSEGREENLSDTVANDFFGKKLHDIRQYLIGLKAIATIEGISIQAVNLSDMSHRVFEHASQSSVADVSIKLSNIMNDAEKLQEQTKKIENPSICTKITKFLSDLMLALGKVIAACVAAFRNIPSAISPAFERLKQSIVKDTSKQQDALKPVAAFLNILKDKADSCDAHERINILAFLRVFEQTPSNLAELDEMLKRNSHDEDKEITNFISKHIRKESGAVNTEIREDHLGKIIIAAASEAFLAKERSSKPKT